MMKSYFFQLATFAQNIIKLYEESKEKDYKQRQ